jgi:hypothetical protein
LLLCTIAVFVLSLLIRLGAWIARRRLKLSLNLSRREQWIHLVARIGAAMFIVTLLAWVMVVSNPGALLEGSFAGKLMVLYALGVVAVVGCLGIVVETVVRVTRGPGGWLVRVGEVVVALAALYAIWFMLAFGMINFVTNF